MAWFVSQQMGRLIMHLLDCPTAMAMIMAAANIRIRVILIRRRHSSTFPHRNSTRVARHHLTGIIPPVFNSPLPLHHRSGLVLNLYIYQGTWSCRPRFRIHLIISLRSIMLIRVTKCIHRMLRLVRVKLGDHSLLLSSIDNQRAGIRLPMHTMHRSSRNVRA